MLLRHDPAPLAHVLDDFEGDSTERLTGFTAPAVADPDPDDVLLYIYAFAVRRRPPKNCDPALLLSYDGKPHSPLFWVKAGNRWHVARLETDRKRLLFRAGRCVRVERDRDGFQFFVRVYHLRRWVSLLPLAFCVLLLALSLTLCGSGRSGIAFFEGQSRTSSERTKPIQQTDFASYTATPDTVTWRAGETRQDISLSLPANCSVDGKDGGNPVCSTVAIACDLDSNGKFDDSEIVWSATDPDSGSPLYIRPGFGIKTIELKKPLALAAGEYRARTIWRSVLLDSPSTSAGSASFDWLLKVE